MRQYYSWGSSSWGYNVGARLYTAIFDTKTGMVYVYDQDGNLKTAKPYVYDSSDALKECEVTAFLPLNVQ